MNAALPEPRRRPANNFNLKGVAVQLVPAGRLAERVAVGLEDLEAMRARLAISASKKDSRRSVARTARSAPSSHFRQEAAVLIGQAAMDGEREEAGGAGAEQLPALCLLRPGARIWWVWLLSF